MKDRFCIAHHNSPNEPCFKPHCKCPIIEDKVEQIKTTWTKEEVEEIARNAYKAGHNECLRDWNADCGIRHESYEDYYKDFREFPGSYQEDERPQLDNWIKENIK